MQFLSGMPRNVIGLLCILLSDSVDAGQRAVQCSQRYTCPGGMRCVKILRQQSPVLQAQSTDESLEALRGELRSTRAVMDAEAAALQAQVAQLRTAIGDEVARLASAQVRA